MGTLTLAASTVDYAPANVSKQLVSNYTDSDSTDTFTISMVQLGLATPDPFSLSATMVNTQTTLTTSSNFNDVRKGDGVSSASGITGGTTVADINHVEGVDTKSLTLSAPATADLTQSVTFTPAAPTGQMFILTGKVEPVPSASRAKDTFQLTVDVYTLNGKDEAPANPSLSDATKVGSVVATNNFPTYEANVSRS